MCLVLLSASDAGVISLLIFLASATVLSIPVFASRGKAQFAWGCVVSVLLALELAALITWVAVLST